MTVVATEAQQCPTLYMNGFGGHRIGDRRQARAVGHNVRNTDAIAAIDDDDCMRVSASSTSRLREYSRRRRSPRPASGGSISSGSRDRKHARRDQGRAHFEMDEHDVIFTVFVDSAGMYGSRVSGSLRRTAPTAVTRRSATSKGR